MSRNIEYVNPKHLILDAGTQSRTTLNKDVVTEYSELFKHVKAKEWPEDRYPFKEPVNVIRTPEGKLIVWDGFHRTFGAIEAKAKEIQIDIADGTLEEAILLSAGANYDHGLPRSTKDKQRAVKTILGLDCAKEWSNVEIAARAHVSESMVRSVRSVAQTAAKIKVTRKGKTFEVSKRGSKKKDAAPASAAKPAKGFEPERAITRVGNVVGGSLGKKIKEDITTGTLEITPKELAVFAGAPDSTIKRIAPLVVEHGYKPSKAIELLDKAIDDSTTLKEIKLLAAANGGKLSEIVPGGKLTFVIE